MTIHPGPPTKEELTELYPSAHTWEGLKKLVATGDLSLLKRHPTLQKRYQLWSQDIEAQYGTIVNYLIKVRLEWSDSNGCPVADPPYFTATIPKQFVKILPNDWPYAGKTLKCDLFFGLFFVSVPVEIEHYVIWSQLPIFHEDLIHPTIRSRVDFDGLYGFTGIDEDGSDAYDPETALVKECGAHIHRFVLNMWPESHWECAPQRIQSVKDLAHIHVFARKKL